MPTSAAERIARRYPSARTPRWLVITVVAVVAVVAVAWFITAALRLSSPAVSADITTFDVISERQTDFVMTVHRPDPSVEVSCHVFAEAMNHERVGELTDVRIPPGEDEWVSVSASIDTFRQAVSVSVDGCRVLG